jgi:CRP-like cAMP-binding protein
MVVALKPLHDAARVKRVIVSTYQATSGAGLAASQELHVATIGPGAVVGEMALIGHKPRNATVTAQTPMRLFAFNISSFKKLLDERPVAQKYIYELLEARAQENRGE